MPSKYDIAIFRDTTLDRFLASPKMVGEAGEVVAGPWPGRERYGFGEPLLEADMGLETGGAYIRLVTIRRTGMAPGRLPPGRPPGKPRLTPTGAPRGRFRTDPASSSPAGADVTHPAASIPATATIVTATIPSSALQDRALERNRPR